VYTVPLYTVPLYLKLEVPPSVYLILSWSMKARQLALDPWAPAQKAPWYPYLQNPSCTPTELVPCLIIEVTS
jgi:hypothetical protein